MKKKLLVCLLCSSLVLVGFAPFVSSLAIEDQYLGPNVGKIIFSVITGDDAQILALQDNSIDMIGDMVDPSFLQQLQETENVQVANHTRNGYGYVTINCDKYPFNITAFRRALAFALDKEAICDDVWDGLAVPQDSCVPRVNPFSVEGELPYTYYEANVAKGAALLTDAGFADIDSDGLLEAPDGSDFDVVVEVAQSSSIAIEVGQKVAEALQALDIDGYSVPTDFYDYLNRLYFHGDYDIVFLSSDFNDFNVDWLAYEYWSEYAYESYWNYPNFRNASYDSWRDQLLYDTEYASVYEAAIEMQKIWVFESPMIICYANAMLSAYRTDSFEGFVNHVTEGVPNWWTNYEVKLKPVKGGPIGGTFRRSNPLDVDTFNFMVSSSVYSEAINEMLWDSLLRQDSEGMYVPWLAESYSIETHDDNSAVTDGHVKFTFNLVQNALWTDGTPIDAEDVAFTLNYYKDGAGNPLGVDLIDLAAAYAQNPYTLIVEFDSESYWHLSKIATKPVLPQHIFTKPEFPAWNEWNPDPSDPVGSFFITSGPFTISSYVAGEFTELTHNLLYWKNPRTASLEPPALNGPDELNLEVGRPINELTWSCSDPNPLMYTITRNNTVVDTQMWDGSDISISLETLDVGVYNYTIYLSNTYGLMSVHTVIVYVWTNLAPYISGPDTVSYEYGTTENKITWICSDTAPSICRLYIDGEIIEETSWDGSNLTKSIDGLLPGSYNFTMELVDDSGLSSYDSVLVEVIDGGPLISMENISMIIVVGSILVIVIFGTAIIKNR